MLMFVSTTCLRPLHCDSMGPSAVALRSLHQFDSLPPLYISFTEGTLSSPLPVEIVCFWLCHLNLVKQNSTWIMFATQQPDFAAALCVQSMFPANIAVAYLSEDIAVPEAFVSNLSAVVSNCDLWRPLIRVGPITTWKTGFPWTVRE